MDANLIQNRGDFFPLRTSLGYGVSDGGNFVVAPTYKWLQSFYGGYAYAETFAGGKVLLNTLGEAVDLRDLVRKVCIPVDIEFFDPNCSNGSPGGVLVRTDKDFLILSLGADLQIDVIGSFGLDCSLAPYFANGWLLIRVEESGVCRTVLSRSDQETVSLKGVEHVDSPYSECEFLAVKDQFDASFSYYNVAERVIMPGKYHLAYSFSDGFGLVQSLCESSFEFLDQSFRVVDLLQFDWADVFRYGRAAGVKGECSGYFSPSGVCEIESDCNLGRFNRLGHAIIENVDGDKSIIDANGDVLLSCISSCTFFDGDYPFYHCERNGIEFLLTRELKQIFGSIRHYCG